MMIKQIKPIVFILSVLLFSLKGFSQEKNEEEKKREVKGTTSIQIGIRSGLNVSFSSGNQVEQLDSRIAYHVGSYVQIPTKNKKMILEIGGFYSLEGYKAALLYDDEVKDKLGLPAIGNKALTRLDLDYLDVQFILKDNQNEKFSAYGGFETSYLLNSTIVQEYTDTDGNVQVYESTDSKGLAKVQIGVLIGLEYHINHFFHINAQYAYPLSRIISSKNSDVKNNTIKLSAGFTF